MEDKRELLVQRLAAAVNLLRPDWPKKSIITHLNNKHSHRPIQDLAIALVAVAVDPKTVTPKRLEESGPWWQAAQVMTGEAPRELGVKDPCPLHPYQEANCSHCRAEYLTKGEWPTGTNHPESRKTHG